MQTQVKAKVSLTFGFYRGNRLVRRESVTQDVIKVGTDPKSHLAVDDELASRRHAVIEVLSPDDITLIDLGNEPVTTVNGVGVNKAKIRPGDHIQVGGTLLVLERAGLAAPDAPETHEGYAYAMIKSGPDVNPDEVESTHLTAVEVMVLWGTTVLHVQHLSPPRSFYVGEEEDKTIACDYFIPAEKLGTTRAPIVLADASSIRLVIPRGAGGEVEFPGQSRMTLAEAVRLGHTQPCAELSGAEQMPLPQDGKARVEIEGFVFQVAVVPAGKPVATGLFAGADWNSYVYGGLSLLAHASLIASLAFFVPPMGVLGEEGMGRDQQYLIQQYLDASAQRERENPPTEQVAESAAADDREGGTGTQAAGAEGSMGTPNTRETGHRYGIRGPEDNPDPHIAREAAISAAASFGIIGLLGGGDPDAPTAPWGREDSLGTDPLSARGNMWGNDIGNAFGAGGLGLVGGEEGGGKSGLGIGLGPLGTIGHGAGLGPGDGFGDGGNGIGHGRFRRPHAPTAPLVRTGGPVTLNGHLPGEVIQRIVRQNYGRFRLCYENGLRNNPNLQGRVAVRFVIGRDGAVSSVSNGGSDLPDSAVVECVVRAYYQLSFPQPDGGIVSVVYPIVFSPGG